MGGFTPLFLRHYLVTSIYFVSIDYFYITNIPCEPHSKFFPPLLLPAIVRMTSPNSRPPTFVLVPAIASSGTSLHLGIL